MLTWISSSSIKGHVPTKIGSALNRKTLPLAIAGLAILVGSILAIRRCVVVERAPAAAPTATQAFVGSKLCGECHRAQFKSWQGSHHQLAMQPATDVSVLGNFASQKFSGGGVTSTFSHDSGKFMVRTDGPDGALHDYEIKYTFGVSPLQQYLIDFPQGRLQALGIAWDSRSGVTGGQRWFGLYPGESLKPSDPLHWTAIDQTWNYMCADCHSTNVRKNYDSRTRGYATTYAEVEVGCEACHGPGSDHVAWARQAREHIFGERDQGLTIKLDETAGISWMTDPATGEVRRSAPPSGDAREVELCARCHARRGQIHEDYVHGQAVGDDYRVALLDEDLYFVDGQIKGEVYEYGSFIQSRMYDAGVVCGDCHDPHSSRLRADGNKLCTRCHLSEKYDSLRHHFHPAGTAGTACIACHMPARTYMVVDPRRDHSIRVPRPDLSATLGTPNACNDCHTDRTSQWAADAIARQHGAARIGFQQFGPTLHTGREGAPGSGTPLIRLVSNTKQPEIARATALAILASAGDVRGGDVLTKASQDRSALVRRAAAETLSAVDPTRDGPTIERLLNDRVRTVRIAAAASLASKPRNALPEKVASAFDRASAEYLAAQQLNADRPEAHLNLALFFAKQGKIDRAENELRDALSLDPTFVPAAVNLADLYRELGRDDRAEAVLTEAMRHSPDDASLHYALGLLKVRQKQKTEALELFATASKLQPTNARYAYVYAVALNDQEDTAGAIDTLERSLKLHPYDRDSLAVVISFCERAGENSKAQKYAQVLSELSQNSSEPTSEK